MSHIRPNRARMFVGLALVAALAATLSGCSSSSPSADGPAQRLAAAIKKAAAADGQSALEETQRQNISDSKVAGTKDAPVAIRSQGINGPDIHVTGVVGYKSADRKTAIIVIDGDTCTAVAGTTNPQHDVVITPLDTCPTGAPTW